MDASFYCLGTSSIPISNPVSNFFSIPGTNGVSHFSRGWSTHSLSLERSYLPHFLYSPNVDVPGLIGFTYPDVPTFISGIKNEYFPEIQAFITAAIAVSLVALLLRSLIS